MSTFVVTVSSGDPVTSETFMNPLAVLIIDAHGDGTTAVSDDFTDGQMIAALLALAERMSVTLGTADHA